MSNKTPPRALAHEARRAANSLMIAFNWADTPEGARYWKRVLDRLCDIAEQGHVGLGKRVPWACADMPEDYGRRT